MSADEQVIFGFSRPKIHNVTEKNKPAANKREIKNGTGTLSVGQKVHINTSPHQEDGDEYPGYSEEVRSWKRKDGTSPIVQHRWGSGDREFSNSGQDPFHLGSYGDDGGCTPTLALKEPIGHGRNEVWFESFVAAEDNGGVEVTSPRITFYAD